MTSTNNFEARLAVGKPNSLGNTVEVAHEVLTRPELFEELFNCYFSENEWVRLRVSNAMKRIGTSLPEMLVPYIDRLLVEISEIDQYSTQWTLAQLFDVLSGWLSPEQKAAAINIMKRNLLKYDDWIVLTQTMNTLGKWAKKDQKLAQWLIPELERCNDDSRKAVAGKAFKTLKSLKAV